MRASRTADPHSGHLEGSEKRSIYWASVIRLAGAPLSALTGFIVTGLIIRTTGSVQFGVINLIATSVSLLAFADLGIGALVTTAAAKLAAGITGAVPDFAATVASTLKVLTCVVLVIQTCAVGGAALELWGRFFGVEMTPADERIVALVLVCFSLSIPLGLGARILVGIGKSHLVAVMAPAISLTTLVLTVLLTATAVPPLALSVPPVLSVLLVNMAMAILAAKSVVRMGVKLRSATDSSRERLLAGSMAMFVVTVSLALGLNSGRLVVSHLGTDVELANYSLAAQLFGSGWAAVAVGGTALWPIFVKRRSGTHATLALWRKSILMSALIGVGGLVVLSLAAPWAARLISGGSIAVDYRLAISFGLLFFVQCLHLPSGMMLTMPDELRFQAFCSVATGLASILSAVLLVPIIGASGAVLATTCSVLLFQVIPELALGTRLVRERPASA